MEKNVQSVSTGTELCVAVHQMDDLGGSLGIISAVCYASIQINGADTIENSDAYTVVAAGLNCCFVGYEAAGIVAFGSLSGIRLIRNLGAPSVPFLIAPQQNRPSFVKLSGKTVNFK